MAGEATDLYFPDEVWENVCTFVLNNDDHSLCFESLSLVSKQLLSITNRFKFSLTISNQTLPTLFHRFPNLNSLHLTGFRPFNLDHFLCQISRSRLQLKSLNLSNNAAFPRYGMLALSRKMKTSLKSLIYSKMVCLDHFDLRLIADSFPFLEELDLSFPIGYSINFSNESYRRLFNYGVQDLFLALPNLRKVNLSGNTYITDYSLICLCKTCDLLEEILIDNCSLLTFNGIAFAIRQRPTLRYLSISNFPPEATVCCFEIRMVNSDFIHSMVSLKGLTCLDLSNSIISDEFLYSIGEEVLPLRKLVLHSCCNYTYDGIFSLLCKCRFIQHLDLRDASFLNDQCVADLSLILRGLVSINVSGCEMLTDSAMVALARNCPLLREISMQAASIGKGGVGSLNTYHQVKSLYLACNSFLKDERISMFASIFPNLELLDLSSCSDISDQGIFEVLRRCCKIRNLTINSNPRVQLLGMNFQVPKLEVLNMSKSRIDDKTLYVISRSCRGLLQLDLQHCVDVTEKGVRLVMESCTKLRKINLSFCHKVAADVFVWMVITRPSLRKIIAPLQFCPSDSEKEFLLQQRCLILVPYKLGSSCFIQL